MLLLMLCPLAGMANRPVINPDASYMTINGATYWNGNWYLSPTWPGALGYSASLINYTTNYNPDGNFEQFTVPCIPKYTDFNITGTTTYIPINDCRNGDSRIPLLQYTPNSVSLPFYPYGSSTTDMIAGRFRFAVSQEATSFYDANIRSYTELETSTWVSVCSSSFTIFTSVEGLQDEIWEYSTNAGSTWQSITTSSDNFRLERNVPSDPFSTYTIKNYGSFASLMGNLGILYVRCQIPGSSSSTTYGGNGVSTSSRQVASYRFQTITEIRGSINLLNSPNAKYCLPAKVKFQIDLFGNVQPPTIISVDIIRLDGAPVTITLTDLGSNIYESSIITVGGYFAIRAKLQLCGIERTIEKVIELRAPAQVYPTYIGGVGCLTRGIDITGNNACDYEWYLNGSTTIFSTATTITVPSATSTTVKLVGYDCWNHCRSETTFVVGPDETYIKNSIFSFPVVECNPASNGFSNSQYVLHCGFDHCYDPINDSRLDNDPNTALIFDRNAIRWWQYNASTVGYTLLARNYYLDITSLPNGIYAMTYEDPILFGEPTIQCEFSKFEIFNGGVYPYPNKDFDMLTFMKGKSIFNECSVNIQSPAKLVFMNNNRLANQFSAKGIYQDDWFNAQNNTSGYDPIYGMYIGQSSNIIIAPSATLTSYCDMWPGIGFAGNASSCVIGQEYSEKVHIDNALIALSVLPLINSEAPDILRPFSITNVAFSNNMVSLFFPTTLSTDFKINENIFTSESSTMLRPFRRQTYTDIYATPDNIVNLEYYSAHHIVCNPLSKFDAFREILRFDIDAPKYGFFNNQFDHALDAIITSGYNYMTIKNQNNNTFNPMLRGVFRHNGDYPVTTLKTPFPVTLEGWNINVNDPSIVSTDYPSIDRRNYLIYNSDPLGFLGTPLPNIEHPGYHPAARLYDDGISSIGNILSYGIYSDYVVNNYNAINFLGNSSDITYNTVGFMGCSNAFLGLTNPLDIMHPSVHAIQNCTYSNFDRGIVLYPLQQVPFSVLGEKIETSTFTANKTAIWCRPKGPSSTTRFGLKCNTFIEGNLSDVDYTGIRLENNFQDFLYQRSINSSGYGGANYFPTDASINRSVQLIGSWISPPNWKSINNDAFYGSSMRLKYVKYNNEFLGSVSSISGNNNVASFPAGINGYTSNNPPTDLNGYEETCNDVAFPGNLYPPTMVHSADSKTIVYHASSSAEEFGKYLTEVNNPSKSQINSIIVSDLLGRFKSFENLALLNDYVNNLASGTYKIRFNNSSNITYITTVLISSK